MARKGDGADPKDASIFNRINSALSMESQTTPLMSNPNSQYNPNKLHSLPLVDWMKRVHTGRMIPDWVPQIDRIMIREEGSSFEELSARVANEYFEASGAFEPGSDLWPPDPEVTLPKLLQEPLAMVQEEEDRPSGSHEGIDQSTGPQDTAPSLGAVFVPHCNSHQSPEIVQTSEGDQTPASIQTPASVQSPGSGQSSGSGQTPASGQTSGSVQSPGSEQTSARHDHSSGQNPSG
ncbi:MAG: hypothetical protein M1831_002421 [Alyxoria varia]|nr:MAG: hypothetical protein M1831_002421 [Alyxoria varia]